MRRPLVIGRQVAYLQAIESLSLQVAIRVSAWIVASSNRQRAIELSRPRVVVGWTWKCRAVIVAIAPLDCCRVIVSLLSSRYYPNASDQCQRLCPSIHSPLEPLINKPRCRMLFMPHQPNQAYLYQIARPFPSSSKLFSFSGRDK